MDGVVMVVYTGTSVLECPTVPCTMYDHMGRVCRIIHTVYNVHMGLEFRVSYVMLLGMQQPVS